MPGLLHKCIISVWENRFTRGWKGWQNITVHFCQIGVEILWMTPNNETSKKVKWRNEWWKISLLFKDVFCKGRRSSYFFLLFKNMSCTVDNKNYLEWSINLSQLLLKIEFSRIRRFNSYKNQNSLLLVNNWFCWLASEAFFIKIPQWLKILKNISLKKIAS